MNSKTKIIIIFLVFFFISGFSYLLFFQGTQEECMTDECLIREAENQFENSLFSSGSDLEEVDVKGLSKEEAKEKIDTIRKKLALKGLILKGDTHFENQQYTTALAKYLKIRKEIPNDLATTYKIGETYYALKKYKPAIKFFREAKDYIHLDKQKYLDALLYAEKIDPDNIKSYKKEILSLELDPQLEFYYTNSLGCVEDFSLCKKNFQDYFALQNQEENISESGAILTPSLIPELQTINEAIINYQNFQIDDIGYKNALVTGAFFVNKLYPLAIHTAGGLLEEKPGYRPMLKIIAQSYYEMGYYIEAKKHLNDYNSLGDNDPEISYFLGVVYQRLNEYIMSVIHFKKALKLGYHSPVDIRRRLVYNYYKLDEIDKILAIFNAMMLENFDQLEEHDLSLTVYYHILHNRLDQAKNFTQLAKSKFTNNELFYGYYAWIIVQEYENSLQQMVDQAGTGSISDFLETDSPALYEAQSNIQTALDLNNKNPMIHLISGMIEQLNKNEQKALIHYKQTIALDLGGDFETIAKQRIETLNNIQK